MKIIRLFIDQFGIGGLVIGSIFSFLIAIVLFLSTIFNFPPYITFSKGSKFGMTDYSKGIPLDVNISISTPAHDTNIIIRTKKGTWANFHLSNNIGEKRWHLPQNDSSILYSDTIFTNIETSLSNNKERSHATNLEIQLGKVYVKPSNFKQRVVFNLPTILKFLLIGFCAWQIAMVLSFIRAGKAFTNKNFKRIAWVGWSLIIYPLSILLIELFFESSLTIEVNFTSSILNYRPPFLLYANVSSQINMIWIIIGCIFLITAQAFQKGYKLQQEQDLTI